MAKPPSSGATGLPQPAEHAHPAHDHTAHSHAAAAPRGFQPLAATAGSRLARVGAAIAVLWAAVAWALLS